MKQSSAKEFGMKTAENKCTRKQSREDAENESRNGEVPLYQKRKKKRWTKGEGKQYKAKEVTSVIEGKDRSRKLQREGINLPD